MLIFKVGYLFLCLLFKRQLAAASSNKRSRKKIVGKNINAGKEKTRRISQQSVLMLGDKSNQIASDK